MSKPVIKIVRAGEDVRTAEPKDFSVNTNYPTPKIYMQKTLTADEDLTNELGYPHGSWGFRRLTSSSFYRKNTEAVGFFDPENWYAGSVYSNLFSGDEYTYFNPDSTDDGLVSGGIIVDADEVKVKVADGDASLAVVLFVETLTSSSVDIDLPTGPGLFVGESDNDLNNTNPSEQVINTKLDTLKIFKTGTLSLSLPAETLTYKSDSKSYEAKFNHGLGYPPMYFPPETVSTGFVGQQSQDVYVDDTYLYLRVIRCSYGDDAFGTPGGSKVFSAQTISFNYTIFYNDITEEFDLLS